MHLTAGHLQFLFSDNKMGILSSANNSDLLNQFESQINLQFADSQIKMHDLLKGRQRFKAGFIRVHHWIQCLVRNQDPEEVPQKSSFQSLKRSLTIWTFSLQWVLRESMIQRNVRNTELSWNCLKELSNYLVYLPLLVFELKLKNCLALWRAPSWKLITRL